jgi:hypothetical protein
VPRYAELTSSCVSLPDALRTCWSILRAVSSGANRISEIAGRVGVPANQLTRYLGALSDLGLVTRDVPVTERAPEKSKVAWAFEPACRQLAEDELLQLGGVKVGRFWDRHAEVDVVAVDEDGQVVLAGECT